MTGTHRCAISSLGHHSLMATELSHSLTSQCYKTKSSIPKNNIPCFPNFRPNNPPTNRESTTTCSSQGPVPAWNWNLGTFKRRQHFPPTKSVYCSCRTMQTGGSPMHHRVVIHALPASINGSLLYRIQQWVRGLIPTLQCKRNVAQCTLEASTQRTPQLRPLEGRAWSSFSIICGFQTIHRTRESLKSRPRSQSPQHLKCGTIAEVCCDPRPVALLLFNFRDNPHPCCIRSSTVQSPRQNLYVNV